MKFNIPGSFRKGQSVTFVVILFSVFLQGCWQRQSDLHEEGLQDRVLQLEQRVNFLESAIARQQGTEAGSTGPGENTGQGTLTPGSATSSTNAELRDEGKSHQSYSGRCQATTRKGSQCKRSAKAGSNYCWQH
ncbi:MAG: hypothetical protein ABWZ25_11485 [Chitinophagaceae bacterium]